ncbi:PIG-L family deacetylase [Polaribacter sp. MSW13]|uniref:PIG-L family deacetylase n=1 Tax=Polaribacter marinus TaxID=2916838 RepID=A0A9X1VQG9_9FLAO|nr:PIG-L deacetylase family protein [Polaribacter marinus]MCI2227551.1 PIG-L family deacetylase [Polaribacter marinus]
MKNKILVIAPHADDEIIGCGGTIAKAISNGSEVFVVIATNASIGAPELFDEKAIDIVRQEALAAHNFLGIKKTFFLDFPAPALNAFPEYKISIELSKIINKLKPNILYLPHPGDLHQDHKAIYRASLVASRPQGEYSIKEIYCYETLSETEWAPRQEKAFVPNMFNDVTDFFEEKLTAMKFFKSQIKEFPHTRSTETFEALAKYRGATVGVKRAESFIVERIIKN